MTDILKVSASAVLGIRDIGCMLWEGPLDVVSGVVAREQAGVIRVGEEGRVRTREPRGRRSDDEQRVAATKVMHANVDMLQSGGNGGIEKTQKSGEQRRCSRGLETRFSARRGAGDARLAAIDVRRKCVYDGSVPTAHPCS